MALGINVLDTGTAAANSTTSATIAPSNTPVFVVVAQARESGGPPDIAAVSGCGLTWQEVNGITSNASYAGRRRLSVVQGTGTPTSGQLTITGSGSSLLGIAYAVMEISGADSWGNAASANDGGGSGTSATTTLSGTPNTGDWSIAFGAIEDDNDPTWEGGWTEDGDISETGNVRRLTFAHSTAHDSTPSFSWTGSAGWAIVGFYIFAAAGGGETGGISLASELDASFTAQVVAITDLALARDHAVSQTAVAATLSGLNLTIEQGITQSGAAQALAAVSLARDHSVGDGGAAATLSGLNLAIDAGITQTAVAIAGGNLALAREMGLTLAAQVVAITDLALAREMDMSQTAVVSGPGAEVGSVTLAHVLAVSFEGVAGTLGDLTFAIEQGITQSGAAQALAAVSLARDHSMAQTAVAGALAALALAHDRAMVQAAAAAALGDLALARETALQITAIDAIVLTIVARLRLFLLDENRQYKPLENRYYDLDENRSIKA